MNLKLQMVRRLAYSLLFTLIGSASIYSLDVIEVDKVIEKSFPISSDGTLTIENRYGAVTVTDTETDEVKIKVTIEVKTNSQSKADDIFDKIEIDFSNSSSAVSVKTEIEESSGWTSWFSWGSSTDYEINYEIAMPPTVHLVLNNKYGDVYLPDLNNGLNLVLKYGNAVTRSVEGKMNLDLGYGKIEFGDVGELNADIKYSKMSGSSTQRLTIESKYSQVSVGDVAALRSNTKYDSYTIDRVTSIDNDGKYDNWKLGEVGSLSTNTKYTSIEIEKLIGDLRVDQKYGSVKIKGLSCDNAEIDMSVEYTDVEIFASGCGIEIDYQGEYTGLRLPDEMDDVVERDGHDTWLEGRFGNGARKIKLEMDYGSLRIR